MKTINKIKELSKFVKLSGEPKYKIDEDNRAIINVGAEKYDDIFSPYCYKGGDSLKMELVDYIDEKAACVPLNTDLSIVFHMKEANESKKVEVEDALYENYENDIIAINQRKRRNTIFALFLLVIGLAFFLTYILVINIAPLEINLLLEILTWVFVWESLDKFLLDRRLLQLEKLKKIRLLHAKIEVKEFEPY